MKEFERINRGFNQVFKAGNLSIGLVVPIENYEKHPIPDMSSHLGRAQLADQLGFSALWVRDIPFHLPSFGDAGQTFDPFTYLGFLSGQTQDIALGIGSIALPLRHPLHVAKSAATIDQLSEGRLIMGVASGDRFEEYPGMGIDYESRGERFRKAFSYIRKLQEDFPVLTNNPFGELDGRMTALPKPKGHKIPMLVTGFSRQSLDWNAEHGDGWMYYPRNFGQQLYTIKKWRGLVQEFVEYEKPFMQPLYIDLVEDQDSKPIPIHLGFRIGSKYLIEYLEVLREMGVNHVGLNLRFNARDIDSTLQELAEKVLPIFNKDEKQTAKA
ncbi:MAG: LLM class oxidoreductase [Bacteroidia bacterium]|nr:LLM class oxidoreductase [Bacteroidia bacterium]